MSWCVEPSWPNPLTSQLTLSFGAPYVGNLDSTTWPAGFTLEDMVAKFNGVEEGQYTWFIEDGCLCVDSPPEGGAPSQIKWEHGEVTGTDEFFDKISDESVQECLDCFEQVFGCSLFDLLPDADPIIKADIVAAIQGGLPPNGGPAPVSTAATIVGTVLAEDWAGNAWAPTDGVGAMVAPINPACGPPDWGALVIDLNLPAGTTVGSTAQTSFEVLDASAGFGTTYVYDKSTQTVLGQTYPPGAGGQGNNVPLPIPDTISFTVPADPTAVCLVVAAFGHAGAWGEDDCDQISPGETIITVAPHPCGPALACLEEMFGCSLEEMMEAAGVLKDDVVPAYGLTEGTPGVRNREWHGTYPSTPTGDTTVEYGRSLRLAHDFSLTPVLDTVTAALVVNDTDNTIRETDVQVLDTYVTVPAGGSTLTLSGGSEGYWAVEVGYCCGPLVVAGETAWRGSSLPPLVVNLPEGHHSLRVWNLDPGGTNSSQAVAWSTPVDLSTTKREWDCIMVPQCDPAPEGYSFKAPLPCGVEIVDPAPVLDDCILPELEVPEMELTLTAPEGTSITQPTIVQDTWRELDCHGNLMAVTFNTRTRVSQAAGDNWAWLNVPLVAGWQQPQVMDVGNYRSSAGQVQNDDNAGIGNAGASPHGPFMGCEVHHWSSLNRIYLGYQERDNAVTSNFVSAMVRYVRA